MSYQINWSGNTYSNLKDHELYQKWSVKSAVQVVAAKSDLVSDMGKITMNKDSVYIVDYLSWLARTSKLLIDLS